ncbi:MAG: GNAT family protein [Pseudomonadota bacterium]
MSLPVLTTERLTLREATLEDGPTLQAYQSRPENWQLQAVEPEEYADGERIARYLQYRGSGDARRIYAFVARRTATDDVIGETGISRVGPEIFELGFSVDPRHWGFGFAREMARSARDFSFDALMAHRVTAAVAMENVACCRVLETIGMTREGTSRDCIKAQGRWWSEHQYAILATDVRT